jgi:hypothetical protein
MKKKKIVGLAACMATFAAAACVVAYDPTCTTITHNCPDGTTTPDGTQYQSATCDSNSIKHLATDSARGFTSTSSSGTCHYSCHYTDANGVSVNCDGDTGLDVNWSGTKPSSQVCPVNSGSGGGGGDE